MNILFCIKHEKTVKAYHSVGSELFHERTVQVSNSPDPGTRYDLEYCDFDDGWATVPPPEFDIEEYMERIGNPPIIIEESENFNDADKAMGYDYDPQTDQVIQWEVAP